MTTLTHKPVTCKNPECKIKFTPQVNYSNLIVSGYCPECRFAREMAKRRIQSDKMNHREPISDKMALKSKIEVVRKKRTTELSQKSLPELHGIAERHFNKFIRLRDRIDEFTFYCPTCRTYKRIVGKQYQACHCFPAGKFSSLKYNEKNVYGGCLHCNYYQHGTNYIYNDWVREKIGEAEYNKLKMLSNISGEMGRFEVIQIIETYKAKNKAFGKPDNENILEGNNF